MVVMNKCQVLGNQCNVCYSLFINNCLNNIMIDTNNSNQTKSKLYPGFSATEYESFNKTVNYAEHVLQ